MYMIVYKLSDFGQFQVDRYLAIASVGIGLKECGVRCRNVWHFAQGLKRS